MFHLLKNANVFAPEPLGIQDILVCAGKIVKVGEKLAELDSSLQVQERDFQGRRVIPGLIEPEACAATSSMLTASSGSGKWP